MTNDFLFRDDALQSLGQHGDILRGMALTT